MTDRAVAGAYSASGPVWQSGPGRIYDRLAEELVARCPIPLAGTSVLDLGAGTGAATRAAQRRGAAAVAVDVAVGMLQAGLRGEARAVVGDAMALPFVPGAFDAVIAAFSLNHLTDPVAGLRESSRVIRRGGAVLVATYADDDNHPVKAAVDAAATARGWTAPPWYDGVLRDAVPRLATPQRAREAAEAAGLSGAIIDHVLVSFPELEPSDLVAWRLGMPSLVPFAERLSPGERAAFEAEVAARLGDAPLLVRSVIFLTVRA